MVEFSALRSYVGGNISQTFASCQLPHKKGAELRPATERTEFLTNVMFFSQLVKLIKSYAGIAGVFYCTKIGQKTIMLHSFIKKSQKTPKKELQKARSSMDEVKANETF